ncbi:hypothetical protein BV25DRAFT_1824084 [Artomyces pyxidatus]|uniref:Uncharacterized protein n=1 Tax=Artomyces pyxidatus TaxID=48021 RepID=A0ACB8T6I9_9AGAM|nr:hypothetical protein BV25DRAFT_1824084 [Artomyces pyxidatus]
MADLFSAARHYHELDGTLLGARAVNDAEALIRAHRVLGGGDAGASLVERTAALEEAALARMRSQSALSGTYETGPGGEADIDDARRVQVQLHWLDTDDATAPKQPSVSSRAHSFLERPADWLEEEWGARWDVSEVDVAKVMPRVMTHRLRVRDGPEDEIMSSVMFMAAGPRAEVSVEESGDGVTEFWRRRTVKDIIVKIISEV